MAHLFGWKDVLRPIRDGYRHLFPSPDTGPTPGQREVQRELDRTKGFAYFDTFDQLQAWSETESEPLQRANTPLLARSGAIDGPPNRKATVLLCHDYAGNYQGYEAVQGIGIEEESYSCEYLQFIDAFIYFSHKLVCVPPPSWTNTLHRNGVKALGTVLIEPQTKDSENLLHHTGESASDANVYFPIARKLADLARHFGFDGWLVNIEKPFRREIWDSRTLVSFLRQLKEDLGPTRELIWYDAITTDNRVAYQNALNAKNVSFSEGCGAILTNYCWKESNALESMQTAQEHVISLERVFFGVDVWAQNKTALRHPRITYPEKGGGGTNTGVAVSKLAELGLSVGVFAPAWSFEHFPGRGRVVEQAIWEGRELPEDVSCSCGNTNVRHPSNPELSVIRSARQFPAGSESFFYTDFSRAFGQHSARETDMLYNGWRSLENLCNEVNQTDSVLHHRLEDLPGRTRLIVEANLPISKEVTVRGSFGRSLTLFHFDMPVDGSLRLSIRFRYVLRCVTVRVTFRLIFRNGNYEDWELEEKDGIQSIEHYVAREEAEPTNRFSKLAVRLDGRPPSGIEPVRILEIDEIRIMPRSAHPQPDCSIDGLWVERRGTKDAEHQRLCWTYRDGGAPNFTTSGMPYSDVTGPFSSFLICLEGLHAGRAYALEFIVSEALAKAFAGKVVQVEVIGVGFDGRHIARGDERLRF